MSSAHAVQAVVPSSLRLFLYDKWQARLPRLARQYRENKPCPHILLEGFVEPEAALAMAKEFPQPTSDAWTQYKHANENKLGLAKRQLFPPALAAVTDELNSPEFVAWISELTGIPNLRGIKRPHRKSCLLNGNLRRSTCRMINRCYRVAML